MDNRRGIRGVSGGSKVSYSNRGYSLPHYPSSCKLLLGGEAHWNLKGLYPEAYEEANVSRIKGGLCLKLCCTGQPHPEE